MFFCRYSVSCGLSGSGRLRHQPTGSGSGRLRFVPAEPAQAQALTGYGRLTPVTAGSDRLGTGPTVLYYICKKIKKTLNSTIVDVKICFLVKTKYFFLSIYIKKIKKFKNVSCKA
jgi:hypothetical protein